MILLGGRKTIQYIPLADMNAPLAISGYKETFFTMHSWKLGKKNINLYFLQIWDFSTMNLWMSSSLPLVDVVALLSFFFLAEPLGLSAMPTKYNRDAMSSVSSGDSRGCLLELLMLKSPNVG